eukprot:scaffold1713_cov45-Cyclotella_meneghiniana.AAC.2
MSLSRDMSGHVGTLSAFCPICREISQRQCLVVETCRDMSRDIYILDDDGNVEKKGFVMAPLSVIACAVAGKAAISY